MIMSGAYGDLSTTVVQGGKDFTVVTPERTNDEIGAVPPETTLNASPFGPHLRSIGEIRP
jgi:hypothetical protein